MHTKFVGSHKEFSKSHEMMKIRKKKRDKFFTRMWKGVKGLWKVLKPKDPLLSKLMMMIFLHGGLMITMRMLRLRMMKRPIVMRFSNPNSRSPSTFLYFDVMQRGNYDYLFKRALGLYLYYV